MKNRDAGRGRKREQGMQAAARRCCERWGQNRFSGRKWAPERCSQQQQGWKQKGGKEKCSLDRTGQGGGGGNLETRATQTGRELIKSQEKRQQGWVFCQVPRGLEPQQLIAILSNNQKAASLPRKGWWCPPGRPEQL